MDPGTGWPWRRFARRVAALSLLLALGGCGVGFSIGFGVGGDIDAPPTVSIAANVTSGAPGDAVQLVAAASDDFGVLNVAFYRLADDGSTTLLAVDSFAPYQTNTVLVASATGKASYFARATDGAGQHSDSAPVTITLR